MEYISRSLRRLPLCWSIYDDAVTIIDISTPASPTLVAEIEDEVGGFTKLNGVRSVAVSGDYLYVGAYDDDAVTIIDISTPASPTLVAEIEDEVGGFTELNGVQSVAVSGDYLYVGAVLTML